MNARATMSAIAILTLHLPALAVAQQIHKWTDANGQVHYSDQPPPRQDPWWSVRSPSLCR
jgi:hypothetical protein